MTLIYQIKRCGIQIFLQLHIESQNKEGFLAVLLLATFLFFFFWKQWSEAGRIFRGKSNIAETSALEIFASQHWVIHFHKPVLWLARGGTNRTVRIHFSPRQQYLLLCGQVCNPAQQQSLLLTWLLRGWYCCFPCCNVGFCAVKDLCCRGEKQLVLALLWRRLSSEEGHKEMFSLSSSQTKDLCVCIFRPWPQVSWFNKSIWPETIWPGLDIKHAQTVNYFRAVLHSRGEQRGHLSTSISSHRDVLQHCWGSQHKSTLHHPAEY